MFRNQTPRSNKILARLFSLTAALGLFSMFPPVRAAEPKIPTELEGIGVDEKLGAPIDLSLQFTAENGYQVPLSSFFHKDKPVILNLVYYSCTMLCNRVLNGQVNALREIPWTPGNEFEIVTISINPQETFDMAQKKRAAYVENYGKPAPGWHFLTDYKGNVEKLANQVGFKYRWDERSSQYAHSAAIMFLTPEGKVSRYLYGIQFKIRDMRLALTEASQSKLGITVDRFLLFCFHYDPAARSYVPFARNLMRLGGVLIVFVMGFTIYRLFRGERNRMAPPPISGGLVTAK